MYRSEETCSYTSVPLFSHQICHDVFGKHCMQPDVVANMKCSHLSIDCMQIYSSKETFSYASSESLVELMKHIIIVTWTGVYTTRCRSSAVGLAYTIQKDPVTNILSFISGWSNGKTELMVSVPQTTNALQWFPIYPIIRPCLCSSKIDFVLPLQWGLHQGILKGDSIHHCAAWENTGYVAHNALVYTCEQSGFMFQSIPVSNKPTIGPHCSSIWINSCIHLQFTNTMGWAAGLLNGGRCKASPVFLVD
jgi:hypothetical protein